MRNCLALTIAASLFFSGCSKPEEEEKAGEPVVLSVDCTAEALTGKDALANGEDFLLSVGGLLALGSSVELRIRDDVGWMNFLLPYDWNPHGLKVDLVHVRIQSNGVVFNGEMHSDAQFVKKIDQYAAVLELLDSQGLIVVDASLEPTIADCVKYLRVMHDAGIDQLLLPRPSDHDPEEQERRVKKMLKTVP